MAWVVGIGIFLFLLFAFPKQIVGVIVFIALAGLALWAYIEAQSNAAAKERARIVTSVNASNGCSDPEYPIGVTFSNGTDKRITEIGFTLAATRRGYSSSVYSRYLTNDRIMNAGQVYFGCWRIDPWDLQYGQIKGFDVKTLEWTSTISSVRFAK